ncbi:SDR family NAD(P)-dependent oxidoreductase [Rhodococcus hoagii]|nr:SDR family NAD(P)-dependent oxidoreductase [Prescottella equi]
MGRAGDRATASTRWRPTSAPPPTSHRAVSEAVARFGKLDTLVPNAGIWDYQRSITRLDGESLSAAFDELFAVNVKATAGRRGVVAGAGQDPRQRRDDVVELGLLSERGGPLYTASKHACRGLVLELAYELAPKAGSTASPPAACARPARPESMGMAERSIEASFARSATTGDNPLLPLHDASVDPADFTAPYVLLGLVGQQLQHHRCDHSRRRRHRRPWVPHRGRRRRSVSTEKHPVDISPRVRCRTWADCTVTAPH